MVEKFIAMDKLGRKAGMSKMRVMTGFCGERYWTIVAEMEVSGVDEFEKMMQGTGQKAEDMKEMERLMEGSPVYGARWAASISRLSTPSTAFPRIHRSTTTMS